MNSIVKTVIFYWNEFRNSIYFPVILIPAGAIYWIVMYFIY
jgi:hypothetical protein